MNIYQRLIQLYSSPSVNTPAHGRVKALLTYAAQRLGGSGGFRSGQLLVRPRGGGSMTRTAMIQKRSEEWKEQNMHWDERRNQ